MITGTGSTEGGGVGALAMLFLGRSVVVLVLGIASKVGIWSPEYLPGLIIGAVTVGEILLSCTVITVAGCVCVTTTGCGVVDGTPSVYAAC